MSCRFLFLLGAFIVARAPTLAAPAYDVWPEIASRKILRDAPVPAKVSKTIILDAARNEYEPFQVIVTARRRALPQVKVSVTDLKSVAGGMIPARNIELRLAHYIFLKDAVKPSFPGGWYPDALLPLTGSFSVNSGNNQAVWGNLYVPPGTRAGLYRGAVRVNVGGIIHTVPVRLRVRDFALPVENHFGSAFAIWGGFLAEAYGLKMDSPEYRALYERTYWFLTGYRMPPDDLPVPVGSPEAARYLNDPRVTSYRIPYNPSEPEGFRKRVAYLRQKGWLAKGYVYTIDEPGPEAFANCYQYGKRIDGLAPDAKWLLTAAPSPALHGAVDIWCPDLAYINLQDLHKRQLLGEKVWWYTCVGPQQPYPTYFINDDATSHRVMSWLQSAWNVQGVLYWAVNIWGKYDGKKYVGRDVWKDPLAFPGANGDGYLIYPGKTAKDLPVPTLRLEMIRQGNEDFETFWLLEQSVRGAARRLGVTGSAFDPHIRVTEIVNRVATRLTRWNRDPLAMENARKAALDEIKSVRQKPLALLRTSHQERLPSSDNEVTGQLWTERGATAQASLAGGGNSGKLSLRKEPVQGKSHALYRFTFPLDAPQVRLTVTVRRNGQTKIIERLFLKKAALKAVSGHVLSDWQSPADIARWTLNHVTVEPAMDGDLGACGKLTFQPGAEFPNLRLLEPKGFTGTDWRKYGYLVLTFRNPGPSEVALHLKPLDRGGKTDDRHYILLEPQETTRFVARIKDFGVDISDFQGFELWMFETKAPVTILIEPVVISATVP